MKQESIIQEEGLGEIIQGIKDLTAKFETQLGYAARRTPD
jgi:hypothetical protein